MNKLSFVIHGHPATKKTSNEIVFVQRRDKATGISRRVPIIMPSQDYEAWFKHAMQQAVLIKSKVHCAGHSLPIEGPVHVSALFYREADRGDLTGFMNALGDWLQMPRQKDGKTTREGAGLIVDDRFIESWDGTRKLVDATRPRIEVSIIPLRPTLFDATQPEVSR